MAKIILNRSYGWKADRPDGRDVPYMAIRPASFLPIELPKFVDLRPYCPPVYDQGSLGSCTANAIVAAYDIDLIKKTGKLAADLNCDEVALSRLFVYYNERLMEGTVEIDAGGYIRDGIKSVNNQGICLENLHPYDPANFRQQPSDEAYTEAQNHQALLYAAVGGNSREICMALADGYPVVFGFTVYESFENHEVASSGIMKLPEAGEAAIGGHAVVAVGYDMDAQHLLVRNSWGTKWGIEGYFWMPFSYILRLTRDWWVIKEVE